MTTLHRSKSDASSPRPTLRHRLWRACLLAVGPGGWALLAAVLLWLALLGVV